MGFQHGLGLSPPVGFQGEQQPGRTQEQPDDGQRRGGVVPHVVPYRPQHGVLHAEI